MILLLSGTSLLPRVLHVPHVCRRSARRSDSGAARVRRWVRQRSAVDADLTRVRQPGTVHHHDCGPGRRSDRFPQTLRQPAARRSCSGTPTASFTGFRLSDGTFLTADLQPNTTSQPVQLPAAGVHFHCSVHPEMVGTVNASSGTRRLRVRAHIARGIERWTPARQTAAAAGLAPQFRAVRVDAAAAVTVDAATSDRCTMLASCRSSRGARCCRR